jgi:hypothetical protein
MERVGIEVAAAAVCGPAAAERLFAAWLRLGRNEDAFIVPGMAQMDIHGAAREMGIIEEVDNAVPIQLPVLLQVREEVSVPEDQRQGSGFLVSIRGRLLADLRILFHPSSRPAVTCSLREAGALVGKRASALFHAVESE